ncbi:MAG: cellulase family glycosylhydrolase [Eubacteriales bacterium]|nr:cellulase family glycosylhydrolase [Eubacteriales bacterium]
MKNKRLISIMITIIMVLSICNFSMPFSSKVQAAENISKELMVFGNKIVLAESPQRVIRLSGVNIPGGEWTGTPTSEKVERSSIVAIEDWNSNVLRLAVGTKGWFGEYSYGSADSYRRTIDNVIQIASERGAYVVLDLHHYKGFNNEKYLTFWRQAAEKYKNNPTVLFGILNEPYGTSWEIWRNGGSGYTGHQQVVEMIRDLGARNIIVAGGLDWAYNISGVMTGYALVDQGSGNNKTLAGNGIVYDTHIYPWKGRTSNWHSKAGIVRMEHPILVGECGWDPATNLEVGGKVYQPGDVMYHDKWVPELLDWIDDIDTYGNYANYTAYSFHPSSAPRMLDNSDGTWGQDVCSYTPTNYWGAYVKGFLADNLSTRYTVLGAPARIGFRKPRLYYNVGDSLDTQNGEIIAYDVNENFYTVPFSDDEVTFSGFDSSKPVDSQTIIVSYMGVSAQYKVNITAKEFMGSATPSTIDKKYISIDFEDAVADSLTPLKFNTTNKADNTTFSIQTYQTTDNTRNVAKIMINSTKYLMAPPKSAAPIDIVMPNAITKEDGRVYVDMRLYRASVSDNPVTVSLVDDNDNKIFTLEYIAGLSPSLIASQAYTNTSYPASLGGRYVRAIINFDTKSFELYQGDSFDNLTSFVAGKEDFAFEDSAATNLNRITNYNLEGAAYEGSIGYDDMDIYTVNTTPKYQWPIKAIKVIDPVANYKTYDELDTKSGTIQIFYDSGIIDEVPLSTEGVQISGFDSMIDGFQTITVKYLGYTTTYQVFVTHYTYLIGIEAVDLRANYGVGDVIDRNTGIINLKYADGTIEAMPFSNGGFTVTGFDSATTGNKTLTIKYGAFTTTFDYKVVPDLKAITVTGLKDSYSADEPVDTTKAWVNIEYIDGSTDKVRLDLSGASVVKKSSTDTNTVTVVITYQSKRYTHIAALNESIYSWMMTLGAVVKQSTEINSNISSTVTFTGGMADADLIVYAKDPTGKILAVDIYHIPVGTTSQEVFLTSEADFTSAKLHCVLWNNARDMEPVAYPVYK